MAVTLKEVPEGLQVQRIAELARLSLDDAEAARYADELSKILEFAQSIRKLDTSNVPPTTHVLDIVDVWREDEVGPMLDRESVLKEGECFVAPKIT